MSSDDVDTEVVEWVDAALQFGHPGKLGQKLMAVLAWVRPTFRKGGEAAMPRSRTDSLALHRRAPGHTRQPLSEPVVFAMANRVTALAGAARKEDKWEWRP